jgi:hypothetical protein
MTRKDTRLGGVAREAAGMPRTNSRGPWAVPRISGDHEERHTTGIPCRTREGKPCLARATCSSAFDVHARAAAFVLVALAPSLHASLLDWRMARGRERGPASTERANARHSCGRMSMWGEECAREGREKDVRTIFKRRHMPPACLQSCRVPTPAPRQLALARFTSSSARHTEWGMKARSTSFRASVKPEACVYGTWPSRRCPRARLWGRAGVGTRVGR